MNPLDGPEYRQTRLEIQDFPYCFANFDESMFMLLFLPSRMKGEARSPRGPNNPLHPRPTDRGSLSYLCKAAKCAYGKFTTREMPKVREPLQVSRSLARKAGTVTSEGIPFSSLSLFYLRRAVLRSQDGYAEDAHLRTKVHCLS